MTSKASVCRELQPEAEQPPRVETVFDIDQPGLGRTVKDGIVWVPTDGIGTPDTQPQTFDKTVFLV